MNKNKQVVYFCIQYKALRSNAITIEPEHRLNVSQSHNHQRNKDKCSEADLGNMHFKNEGANTEIIVP